MSASVINSWDYYNPVKLITGAGSLSQLRERVGSGAWLLVTTKGFTRRGVTGAIETGLSKDTRLLVYDEVTPNPELDELERLVSQYRQAELQGIIALGGGSAIDAAKVLAVAIPSSLPEPLVSVLRQGEAQEWGRKLPLIAIPTTSGTGAEVTPFATVWDQVDHKKYSVMGDLVFPDVALYDPELTLTLPQDETLYTGLDAVSHALESLWNRNRSPISTVFSCRALELAISALPKALNHPSDLGARADMQQASMLSGLAISQTRTAIAHSISYPLTSHYGVPHGLACSFTLPSIIGRFVETPEGSEWKSLMLRVKEMLDGLDLFGHLRRYATEEQVKSLHAEMFHPDRAGNYDGQLTDDVVLEFVSGSSNS